MSDYNNRDLRHPWWEEKTQAKALESASRLFQYFADKDAARVQSYGVYTRLYTNRKIHGQDFLSNYTAAFQVEGNKFSRVPFNVIKIHVDALWARIGTSIPRPRFLTDAGNYTLQRKARLSERWVSNQFYVDDLDEMSTEAFRDGCINGTALIKTYPHPKLNKVMNERVHPGDVFVDPAEAMANAKPTHMYQRAFVSRFVLKKMFPRQAKYIDQAGTISRQMKDRGFETVDNLVEVVEGWKLPSWKGAGDGKHIMFIENATLSLSDWERTDFPFSFFRWKTDPAVGFWGTGLTEELIGLHFDINNSIKHVERCIELIPKPYVLIKQGSGVSEGELGNVPGIILEYMDAKPEIILPPSVPADVVNYISEQWQRASLISGLSSMSMQGRIPSGLETGQAVRDFHDIESKDFQVQAKIFQEFVLDLTRQNMSCGKQVASRAKDKGEKYTVVLEKDKYTIEELDWSDVSLDPDEDSYVVKVLPTNKLSQSPAGRRMEVIELRNAFPGTITEEIAIQLLDFPDLGEEQDLLSSGKREISRLIEKALDDNEYEAPEPTLPAQLGFDMTQMSINEAKSSNVPRPRIAKLRQLLRQFEAFLEEAEEAAINKAQALAQPMGAPQAGGFDGDDAASVEGLQV